MSESKTPMMKVEGAGIVDYVTHLQRENAQLKSELNEANSSNLTLQRSSLDLCQERDQLKAEVEGFKANNRYQRGYAHGEHDEKERTDQWREVAATLEQQIRRMWNHETGPNKQDVARALVAYNKLKEGKSEENDPGMKLRTRKGA